MHVLLSFNEKDACFAEAFRATFFMLAPELEVFSSSASAQIVEFDEGTFKKEAIRNVTNVDAFLLLVGPNGLDDLQNRDCCDALDRSAQDANFILVPVLVAGGRVPQALPPTLVWIQAPVVTDRDTLRRIIDALCSKGGPAHGSSMESIGRQSRFLAHGHKYH